MYQFSNPDWFSSNIPYWNRLKDILPDNKDFLEIGSFEGRSTVWIAENLGCEGTHLHCVDTWDGGPEYDDDLDLEHVEQNFRHNAWQISDQTGVRVLPWKDQSEHTLLWNGEFKSHVPGAGFDLIYIDGSHAARDVITDACLCWSMLKVGGVMVFDDYGWTNMPADYERPRLAVNAFLDCFKTEYEIVWMAYQVAVKKIK